MRNHQTLRVHYRQPPRERAGGDLKFRVYREIGANRNKIACFCS
jgi:hypothetical protein